MDDAVPRSGVTEVTASYGEALRLIGTQDPNGNHIGIVNVSSHGLRLIALGLRTLGLLVVLSLFVLREPFSWLPVADGGPAALVALRDWDLVSTPTWLLGVVLYLAYLAIAEFKNSVFVGQSGAEIHLARHKKIAA